MLEALRTYIIKALAVGEENISLIQGELVLVMPAASIVNALTFLRDDNVCQFTQLMDVCGVDYLDRSERFEVVYHLLSPAHNHRLRVKVQTIEHISVPSVVSVFSSAGWLEREVWDMYGVSFEGHPDLRRILTDYGFVGHPQRKDFPLTGYVELHYDEAQKRVTYAPVQLEQEYRTFDFVSPWEGTDYVKVEGQK